MHKINFSSALFSSDILTPLHVLMNHSVQSLEYDFVTVLDPKQASYVGFLLITFSRRQRFFVTQATKETINSSIIESEATFHFTD